MTTIAHLTKKSALAAIGLGMITLTAHVTAEPLQFNAEIVNLKGQASYSTNNGETWSPAKVGDVLKPGTLVETGKEKSKVDLLLGSERTSAPQPGSSTGALAPGASRPRFSRGNVVRLLEDSVLGIESLTIQTNGTEAVEEIHLDLRSGKTIVNNMWEASRFQIKYPIGADHRGGIAGLGTGPMIYVITSAGDARVFESPYVLPGAGHVGRAEMYSVLLASVGTDGYGRSQVIVPDNAAKRFGAIPISLFCE